MAYFFNDRPALDRPRAAQVGRGRRTIVDRSQPAHHAKYILAYICHNYIKGKKRETSNWHKEAITVTARGRSSETADFYMGGNNPCFSIFFL
jgi:hypothetical protein